MYEQDYLSLVVVGANYSNLPDAMAKAERHTLTTGKQTVVIKHIAVVKAARVIVETANPAFKMTY